MVTYETTVHKDQYKIRVGEIKTCGPGVIRYDWREGLLYCSLNLWEINEGIQRADIINKARIEKQKEQQEPVVEGHQRELVNVDAEILAITSNVPNIRMQKNDKNCWEIVLTEEERQLIDEFLQT